MTEAADQHTQPDREQQHAHSRHQRGAGRDALRARPPRRPSSTRLLLGRGLCLWGAGTGLGAPRTRRSSADRALAAHRRPGIDPPTRRRAPLAVAGSERPRRPRRRPCSLPRRSLDRSPAVRLRTSDTRGRHGSQYQAQRCQSCERRVTENPRLRPKVQGPSWVSRCSQREGHGYHTGLTGNEHFGPHGYRAEQHDPSVECGAALAHDQRYCVDCGARRGPLPAEIAALVGAIHEQGPELDLPGGTPLAGSFAETDRRPAAFGFAMPGPRAAAAAVMCMLEFGVIVGSLVGGTSVATLASAPLIVVGMGHQSTTPAVHTVLASQAGGSDSGVGAAVGGGIAATAAQTDAQASASPTTSPTSTTGTDTTSAGLNGLPPVKHVFMIVLSGPRLHAVLRRFERISQRRAPAAGEVVLNYYAVAGAPLANEIALVSGQGPTAQTATDCPRFTRINDAGKGPRGTGHRNRVRISRHHQGARRRAHRRRRHVEGVRAGSALERQVRLPGPEGRQQGTPDRRFQERIPGVAQPVPVLPLVDQRLGVPRRRGRPRPPQDRSEEREHHALTRLHHPGGVLGRKRGAVQAACDTGARRRQSVPEDGRAGDQEIAGLQGRRDDRDHARCPTDRTVRGPECVLCEPGGLSMVRGLPSGTPVAPAGATGPAAPGTTSTGAAAADTTTTDTTTTDTTTTAPTTAAGTTTTDTTTTDTTTLTDTTTTGHDDHRHDDHRHDDHRHHHYRHDDHRADNDSADNDCRHDHDRNDHHHRGDHNPGLAGQR